MVDNIDFEKIKERILPYFVKVYGEEYKDIIIDKMQRIVPIFYSILEDKQNIMDSELNRKKTELTLKFLEHVQIEVPEEIKNKVLNSGSSFYLHDVEEAKKILNACFGRNEYSEIRYGGLDSIIQEETDVEYKKKQSIEVLKKLNITVDLENYNDWIKNEEAQNIFKYVNSLKEYISQLDSKYNELASQYQQLKETIDKSQKLRNELNEKYMLEFIQSIKEQLPSTDQNKLEKYLNSNGDTWYKFSNDMFIFNIIGNSFYSNGVIEAFSSKAHEKLTDPKTSNFTKNTIIDNKIKYFKQIGLYTGQIPIEKFLTSEEAINSTPDMNAVDKLLEKKKEYYEKGTREYYMATSSYQENLEKINSLHLESNHEFNIDTITNGLLMINPATRKNKNGVPELVTLLIFSPDNCLTEYKDVMFIHEINHCIETSLLSFNDGQPIFKCGYETINDYDENSTRNYEQFSEIQNQLIAMEVTRLMHEDNVFIFDDPKIAKINGGTSYERQGVFCNDLWQNYRNQIIESRVGTTLDPILNAVGKNIFESVNNIINEYSEIPYYQLMSDLMNNKKSEATEKRESLVERYLEIKKLIDEKKNQEYSETSEKTM